MRLYLLRHGIAFNRADPNCPPDPERPLTPLGIRRTRQAARGLRALGVAPTKILSSPYVRAMETAKIVAKQLRLPKKTIAEVAALGPGGDPSEALAEVEAAGADEVLVVGHSPHLEGMLAAVLGVQRTTPFGLKKAGVAGLELSSPPEGDSRLLWLLEPRPLRALAKTKLAKAKPRGSTQISPDAPSAANESPAKRTKGRTRRRKAHARQSASGS